MLVLTQPKGYRKTPQNPKIARLFYRKYPAFVETLLNRHNVYNESLRQVEEAAENGSVFLLRPSRDLGIGRMEKDPARLEEQYRLGREDALAKLEELKAWIRK